MAINLDCAKCGKTFTTSASSARYLCRDCDGSKEAAEKEKKRWQSLSLEERIEELKGRIDNMDVRSVFDMRIG